TACADAITLGGRAGGEFAERARLLPARRRPVEPVLFTCLAEDTLRIDADTFAVVLVGVLVLGIHKGEAGLDRVELVATGAPGHGFPGAPPPYRTATHPPCARAGSGTESRPARR